MEYHCSKDVQISSRIYEFALKSFTEPNDIKDICLAYLDFLISTNDDTSTPKIQLLLTFHLDARALFERIIATLPKEHTNAIWNKMMHYEIMFGEQSVIDKLESRKHEECSGN